MVNYQSSVLDTTFAALSDPTRRAMLARLASRECSISELAEPFDISLPAISRHVRVLEDAGLLVRERDGRIHRCNLDPHPINAASEWLEEMRNFWESRLDALADYLERMEEPWPKQKSLGRSSKSAARSGRRPKESFTPGPTRKK
ncbi:MAG TPA: metalloregulator ArsR/SmtB family transcription factor [Thermoanaerobaculia bacterium]|nr:metalloregulator ArsR/SmtB family transcription factor [Thermoanaerobaculia bacterium]